MFKLNGEKFLKEINEKWTNKNCPMCSRNNWQVDKNIVTILKVDDNAGIQLGGQILPLVPLTCMNCGNTLFVNPLVLGSVDFDKDAEENNV